MAACVGLHLAHDAAAFWLAALIGVALAAACWYACSVYTHMWNRDFQMSPIHHLCCAFASICTLVFVIVFSSLYYTKEAAAASIQLWNLRINSDRPWQDRTFSKAYDKVKSLGVEDFTKFPPPEDGGHIVPITHDESRNAAAELYANEACSDFDRKRPFLSKIVWSRPGIAPELVEGDAQTWLQGHHPGQPYPAERAVELAAENIKDRLNAQTPRVVVLSRLVCAGLFLLIQLIPFGLVGWAAYRDIHVNR
jgi:hypothetical protein